MKTSKIFLMVLMAFLLTACSRDEPKPCKPKIEYVDREVIVEIPIKCVILETKCGNLEGSANEKIIKAIECIINLKENAKVCQ